MRAPDLPQGGKGIYTADRYSGRAGNQPAGFFRAFSRALRRNGFQTRPYRSEASQSSSQASAARQSTTPPFHDTDAQGKTRGSAGRKDITQITADGLPRRFAPRNDEAGRGRNNGTFAHSNAPNRQIFVIASEARQSTSPFRNADTQGKTYGGVDGKGIAQITADRLLPRFAPCNDESFEVSGRNRRPLSRTLLSPCRYLCQGGPKAAMIGG
jgi:hypothetical protein